MWQILQAEPNCLSDTNGGCVGLRIPDEEASLLDGLNNISSMSYSIWLDDRQGPGRRQEGGQAPLHCAFVEEGTLAYHIRSWRKHVRRTVA